MGRKQFTFYESFFSALKRIRKDADRAKAYDAICSYALTGETPDLEALPDAAAIAFDLIRPTLDSAARKSESGKSGGSKPQANSKQTASKTEANGKQTGREKEGEKEKEGEIEVEKENECYILPPAPRARESAAVSLFLDRINPAPAGTVVQELLDFCDALGDDVVIHALQIAVNDRKTAWSYIKAILQRYRADGLTDLAAVLASEQRHEREKTAGRRMDTRRNMTPEEKQKAEERDAKAIEQVKRLREKISGGGG